MIHKGQGLRGGPPRDSNTERVLALLPHFEGLVAKTASQIVEGGVEMDYEDICQVLRVKVWHAVQRFSEERALSSRTMGTTRNGRSPLERYVFGCVLNLRRDLEKRPRRSEASLEGIRNDPQRDLCDWFDAKFLSIDHGQVYGAVDGDIDHERQLDLTSVERQVIRLRTRGLLWQQVDLQVGLSRVQRARVLESVRAKLGELSPDVPPAAPVARPLPAVPAERPALGVLAA